MVAILAVIYVEPFVIIVTGLSGGVTAGTNIAVLAGLGKTSGLVLESAQSLR